MEETTPEIIEEDSGTSEVEVEEITVPETGTEDTSKNSGVEKRINKITAEKYEARRRAEIAERKLAELEAIPQTNSSGIPKIEDFDYDEDKFLEARIARAVDQRAASSIAEQKTARLNEKRGELVRDFDRKVAKSNITGYSETVNTLIEAVPISGEVIDVIMGDDKGPELAYYLGKNLDVADRLTGMSSMDAALELGKISAGLSGKKAKISSKAPAPVKTIGGGSGSGKKDYENMSMQEIYDS